MNGWSNERLVAEGREKIVREHSYVTLPVVAALQTVLGSTG